MVEGSVCRMSTGNVINPDVFDFKEGKLGVAFEVEVGVNLGRVGGW